VFKDELRDKVWNDIRQHDVRAFGKQLTAEVFTEAARRADVRIGRSALNLVNLVWLAIAKAIHHSQNFAFVLTTTLKLLQDQETVARHLLSIKALLLVFDLATLSLVMTLLRQARRHVGWSLAYAWCPLVMKEFANSGHLDAIAVCLTTAAVCAAVHALLDEHVSERRRRGYLVCAVVCLSLAVGAKLYPIILAPLFLVAIARRRGWREGLRSGILLAGCTTAVLWPMLPRTVAPPPALSTESQDDLPPLPAGDAALAPQAPSRGLQAFLGRREMNDFLFMLLIENVKPLAETPAAERPWFALLPESWRQRLVSPLAQRLDVSPKTSAFLLVRVATSLAFVLMALTLAWRAAAEPNASTWLRAAFHTLAWFFGSCRPPKIPGTGRGPCRL